MRALLLVLLVCWLVLLAHRLACVWLRRVSLGRFNERLKRLQTLLIAHCALLEQVQSKPGQLLLHGAHLRFQEGKFAQQVRFCLGGRRLGESQTGVSWHERRSQQRRRGSLVWLERATV